MRPETSPIRGLAAGLVISAPIYAAALLLMWWL